MMNIAEAKRKKRKHKKDADTDQVDIHPEFRKPPPYSKSFTIEGKNSLKSFAAGLMSKRILIDENAIEILQKTLS